MSHLLHLADISRETAERLLLRAEYFLQHAVLAQEVLPLFSGKVVTHLFFEPSTRTLHSFELAAARLGALCLSPELKTSSMVKGESLLDTVLTFEALGTNVFVIRHTENEIPAWVAEHVKTDTAVINAGDGVNEHPSQALIDVMTVLQHRENLSDLSIAIVGDIKHSRVAHSLVYLLRLLGVTDIRLVSPLELRSDRLMGLADATTTMRTGLQDVDVIVCLRLQKERITTIADDPMVLAKQYELTEERLRWAKPDALVMHPGPINRGIEIASNVADGVQSRILDQVKNGVAMRMAILERGLLNLPCSK